MAFSDCTISETGVKASPLVLVDDIFKGADNFYVGLGDVVRRVNRVVEDSMGGAGQYIWSWRIYDQR